MARNRNKSENKSEQDQSKQQSNQPKINRHPLLVYVNLGKRYRSVGIFMILIGLFIFVPVLFPNLSNSTVESAALAGVGVVMMLAGLGFWLFSRIAIKQSYVQCKPSVIEIRTPFYRTVVSYRRIKLIISVQVSQLFERDSLKGISRPLMLPLMNLTTIEMAVKSWPAPKKRLQRLLSKYMFSPREEAWIFIVPNYSLLMREIENHAQNLATADKSTAYEDPFERLKYYQQ